METYNHRFKRLIRAHLHFNAMLSYDDWNDILFSPPSSPPPASRELRRKSLESQSTLVVDTFGSLPLLEKAPTGEPI